MAESPVQCEHKGVKITARRRNVCGVMPDVEIVLKNLDLALGADGWRAAVRYYVPQDLAYCVSRLSDNVDLVLHIAREAECTLDDLDKHLVPALRKAIIQAFA